jgi:hypothetical protein
MKNGVFWDVTPCGSCKNRRFIGIWRLLHQVKESVNQEQHNLQLATDVRCEEIKEIISSHRSRLLVAACVVPSSSILVTLMK